MGRACLDALVEQNSGISFNYNDLLKVVFHSFWSRIPTKAERSSSGQRSFPSIHYDSLAGLTSSRALKIRKFVKAFELISSPVQVTGPELTLTCNPRES